MKVSLPIWAAAMTFVVFAAAHAQSSLPSPSGKAILVTPDNFVRAESDLEAQPVN